MHEKSTKNLAQMSPREETEKEEMYQLMKETVRNIAAPRRSSVRGGVSRGASFSDVCVLEKHGWNQLDFFTMESSSFVIE